MHVVWKWSQGSRCDVFIEALTKDQSLKLQIGVKGAQHLPGDSQHNGRPQCKWNVLCVIGHRFKKSFG